MIEVKNNELLEEIQSLVEKYGSGRETLLPVLQDIQSKYGFVSDYVQQEIARVLDIHPVEVYGVITFYSFLSEVKKGRYIIRLCQTISCDLAGKDLIIKTLERELGIKFGETTKDEKFSLEFINCMGMCDQGPAMMINDKVYGNLTESENIQEILAQYN